jgi:hypothetical protein
VAVSHTTLEDFYELIHALEFHHKYRTEDVEDWIVFERDIKVQFIHQFLEYKKQQNNETG